MVCESGGKGDERGTGRLVTEVGEEDSNGHDGHMRPQGKPMLFRFARHHWTQWSTTRRTTRALATKPYYMTTPIFYPNAAPHIGHLYCLIIADVFARYQRILNPARHVEFLTGTDEHGLKIQKAAHAKCLPPSEFCDLISSQFRVWSCFHAVVFELIETVLEIRRKGTGQQHHVHAHYGARPSPGGGERLGMHSSQ